MTAFTGRCLCGQIGYALDGPFTLMVHCHCSMCRKHHGSAFQTVVAAHRSEFRWLRGAEALASYRSSPRFERAFCPRCGSTLPARNGGADGDLAVVPAGNLEGDPEVRPTMHIFAGSKAPWYDIADDLTRHEAYPQGFPQGFPEGFPVPVGERATLPELEPGTCRGSCLCGAVRFHFRGPPAAMRNCHCSRCRHGRAAAHATNLFVTPEAFEWVAGEDQVEVYDLPGADRFGINFCGQCGSGVPRRSQVAGWNIPAGSLDDDPGLRPDRHIYVGSKAPWFEIRDALPQHLEAD